MSQRQPQPTTQQQHQQLHAAGGSAGGDEATAVFAFDFDGETADGGAAGFRLNSRGTSL